MKIIFDFGANKGQNIEYFLKHADLVVSVEANPRLCELINTRYQTEILEGRLIVENIALSDNKSSDRFVDFYINKRSHVNSALDKPVNLEKFDKIRVFSKTPSSLIHHYLRQGGVAHYVKIDLEGFDVIALNDLFCNHIYPDFISAEYQTIEVFAALILCGKYKAFKMGDLIKESIIHDYDPKNHNSETQSSGRYGNDLPGDWLNADTFFHYFALTGKKGVDIHASRLDLPTELINRKYLPKDTRFLLVTLRNHLYRNISTNLYKQAKRLLRLLKR